MAAAGPLCDADIGEFSSVRLHHVKDVSQGGRSTCDLVSGGGEQSFTHSLTRRGCPVDFERRRKERARERMEQATKERRTNERTNEADIEIWRLGERMPLPLTEGRFHDEGFADWQASSYLGSEIEESPSIKALASSLAPKKGES